MESSIDNQYLCVFSLFLLRRLAQKAVHPTVTREGKLGSITHMPPFFQKRIIWRDAIAARRKRSLSLDES